MRMRFKKERKKGCKEGMGAVTLQNIVKCIKFQWGLRRWSLDHRSASGYSGHSACSWFLQNGGSVYKILRFRVDLGLVSRIVAV
jgi:hypothetical protein